MNILYFVLILTAICYSSGQESRNFTGCETLLQFSLTNGSVIGNLDYHFNRNPDTRDMFADIRGFTTSIPASFDFGIKHSNGEEWHCYDSTTQYQFMSCTHPLIHFDTFTVSLKTSTFLPNLLILDKIIIDNNGMISSNGYSFDDNCIYRTFKYNFYKEPVNVQQKFCYW